MTSLPTWLRRTRLSGRQARARGYRGPLLIATALIGSLAFAAPAAAAAGEESILNSISCTSASFCIAVGSFGGGVVDQGTLAEEWNGSTWSILPTPDLGSPSRLSDVSCTASDACTAVGSGPNSPLAEVWDGSTWSIQSTPDPGASAGFGGVSCTSAGFCMAVGTSESLPMAEEWNGATWSIETVPVPSGTKLASLGKVSCVTETSCMAVGLDIRQWHLGRVLERQQLERRGHGQPEEGQVRLSERRLVYRAGLMPRGGDGLLRDVGWFYLDARIHTKDART